MPLVTVIFILIVVGILLWLMNTYIPMDAQIKKIINILVIIAVVVWLLQLSGLLPSLSTIKFPTVK